MLLEKLFSISSQSVAPEFKCAENLKRDCTNPAAALYSSGAKMRENSAGAPIFREASPVWGNHIMQMVKEQVDIKC